MERLTETLIESLHPKEKAYKVADGGGMYIYVSPSGSKSWRIDYRYERKAKTFTLGLYPIISLTEARKGLLELKKKIKQGIDPSEEKKHIAIERHINKTIEIKKIEIDETIIKVENLVNKMQSLIAEIKELSERGNIC